MGFKVKTEALTEELGTRNWFMVVVPNALVFHGYLAEPPQGVLERVDRGKDIDDGESIENPHLVLTWQVCQVLEPGLDGGRGHIIHFPCVKDLHGLCQNLQGDRVGHRVPVYDFEGQHQRFEVPVPLLDHVRHAREFDFSGNGDRAVNLRIA